MMMMTTTTMTMWRIHRGPRGHAPTLDRLMKSFEGCCRCDSSLAMICRVFTTGNRR